MKHLKKYNESFMDDYHQLSADFEKAKLEFEKKKEELFSQHTEMLDKIFFDLEDYDNNFFKRYYSSTGGTYDDYLTFLSKLFNKHHGDRDWYNSKLKYEIFNFNCWYESKFDQFLDSCFHIMSLFAQLHDSFTLHLSIRWCDKQDRPLRVSGQTPTIPSEGMDDFIKNSLRKDDIEEWKKSLISNVEKIKDDFFGPSRLSNGECGFMALFYIQLK